MTQPPDPGPDPYGQDPQQPGRHDDPSGHPQHGNQYGNPYGAPQYTGGYGPPPSHPQATTVLVLGIVGLIACQVLSPFAWVMGNRAVREIDQSQGRQGGRDQANIGRILGIIGTVILVLGLLAMVLLLVGMVVIGGTAYSSGS